MKFLQIEARRHNRCPAPSADHWTELAACADHEHPDMWYSTAPHSQDRAKEVCSGCEIRQRCLDWGLAHEKHGIWGGVDVATAPVRRRSAA